MFEKHHETLASRSLFISRLVSAFIIALIIIAIAVFVGMVGYHYFEGMGWVDAFVNASMILSGMGPFTQLQTTGGKLFAGFYALFSGLAFILIIGVIIAPVIHRFLHRFHIDDQDIKRKQHISNKAEFKG